MITVLLAENLNARPPYDSKPLISKKGVDRVVIEVESSNWNKKLKGHYTIAVKTEFNCLINIYWNNKKSINFFQLTPNIPTVMNIFKNKKLYFTFMASDLRKNSSDKNGKIVLHWKTDAKSTIYLNKTEEELEKPNENNYTWKNSIPSKGGVSLIEISPKDDKYCVDCMYLGMIESHDG